MGAEVREKEKRIEELSKMQQGDIPIEDVALIFDREVATMRTYKDMGLIKVSRKPRVQDRFDIEDIRLRKEIIDKRRVDMTLRQIADMIDAEVQEAKKRLSEG